MDEIDTIHVLLIESIIADTLATKANFIAKLHTNGQRIRSSQLCEIVTSFLPYKETHFRERIRVPHSDSSVDW